MIQLKEIFQLLNSSLESFIDGREIKNAQAITDASFGLNSIGWCSDKNIDLLNEISEGNVIVSAESFRNCKNLNKGICLIPVENPRHGFLKVLQTFFVEKPILGEVNSSAEIDSSARMNRSKVTIAANVVIEKGCTIGNNVVIGANTVIKSDTIIEDGCKIGSNCTIGGIGFGYELNEENTYELMPHIGNVHLKENVEIGNNVCIDRAVMGSTLLSENVKVDNLVHIAHGVQIGKNSLIIANSMIAGSVVIGDNVWVSPSASIRQKLIVENDALVGMGAVVVKNVTESSVVAGNPAKLFPKK
jgi:UDP-3-O-[3-hydroxymyristoyl] glucosamine N-acyltransferase